jgi:hypothetical protein
MRADEPDYKIEKDDQGRISKIFRVADNHRVSIDPMDQEYCKFVTWAANQTPAVASTFDRLEPGCDYFGSEDDVIAYCKRRSVVLFCQIPPFGGKVHLENIVQDEIGFRAIQHNPTNAVNSIRDSGQFYFYRLFEAVSEKDAKLGNGVDGLYGARLPVFVSHALMGRLNDLLTDGDSEIRSMSTYPVDKTFVYVDVSGFSQHPVGVQLLIINSLIQITTNDRLWRVATVAGTTARDDQEANLCIGDGYIFVFRKPWSAVYFAGYLAALIESMVAHGMLVDFHFRISVNTGPVYRFWDKWGPGPNDGRWNYVGRGITEGERVLTAIGKDKDDVVFISADTRKQIMKASVPGYAREIPAYLQNRGRQEDKHKVLRRLYELNHTEWLGEKVEAIVKNPETAKRMGKLD